MAEKSRRGPRGAYAKSTHTKQRILDAALDVFGQSGFRAGSLREVSEAVGLSEAGILHHYPTKAALLEAVLAHRDEVSVEIFGFSERDSRGIVQLFVDIARYNTETPGAVELYCVLSAEATDSSHPAHAYFMDRYRWVKATLLTALEDLHAKGELRDGSEPVSIVNQTVALLDGMQVQWLLDRTSIDMAEEARRFLNMHLREPLEAGRPPQRAHSAAVS